jgi:hypothetical protein
VHEVFVCWCEALKCFKILKSLKKINFKILGLKRFEKKRKRSLKKNPTLFTLPISARVAQLHPAGPQTIRPTNPRAGPLSPTSPSPLLSLPTRARPSALPSSSSRPLLCFS